MASTTKSPRHLLKPLLEICTKRGKKTFNKEALKHRRWGKDGLNNQDSKALFEGYLWKLAQKGQQRRSKDRRWGKDGFNNQVSNALFEGRVWKLAQRGPTRSLNKGALKHRRLGKDGCNNPFSNAGFAGCVQQTGSTEEPIKHRRMGKDCFNNQDSKALLE